MRGRVAIVLLALGAACSLSAAPRDSLEGRAAPRLQDRRDHAVALALQGRVAQAETLFQSLLSRDDPCGWTGLANLHAMRGAFASALGFYTRALRADSIDAGIVLNRAIVLKLMERDEEAEAEAARGVRMAGGERSAALLLALENESGKAVEFSRVFEIPVPKRRPIRIGSWNVYRLLAPDSTTAATRPQPPAGGSTQVAQSRSALSGPANLALLFYWRR